MLFLTIPLTAEWLSYKLYFVDGMAGILYGLRRGCKFSFSCWHVKKAPLVEITVLQLPIGSKRLGL